MLAEGVSFFFFFFFFFNISLFTIAFSFSFSMGDGMIQTEIQPQRAFKTKPTNQSTGFCTHTRNKLSTASCLLVLKM